MASTVKNRSNAKWNHANDHLLSKCKKQKLANYEIKVVEYKLILMDFNGQYITVDTICDIIIWAMYCILRVKAW